MNGQDEAAAAHLRDLPPVHALIAHPLLADRVPDYGRDLVVDAAREAVEDARAAVLAGSRPPDADALARDARARLETWLAPRPRPVINATGIVLHTNLGRAPISAAAAEAMRAVSTGYSDLEYDLAKGQRGSRHDIVVPLLCRLTGAEAALVVNNNAGATLLILSALAAGHGVVVSRGQLVEIGGGYRIPAILAASGARLVEVGTTNRTHLRDYREAVDADTAMVLRVHTSNFRILGFVAEVGLADLVGLGRQAGVPVVDDLGSGSLLDTAAYGLAPEPLVQTSVAEGADLVCFSGDKLLGGPQAGVIVGRRALVDRLRASPLARALRPGKATLAGLHATLGHYARGEATERVPVWQMIAARPETIAARAAAWREALASDRIDAALVPGHSAVGGGSLPGESMPTTLVGLSTDRPEALAAALRRAPSPVVARVAHDTVLLDPRTVLPEQDPSVLDAVRLASREIVRQA